MTEIQRRILGCITPEVPRGLRPYAEVARTAGVTEDQVIESIRALHEQGIVRRVAAVCNDRKLGYSSNAMVVWCVPEGDIERAGMLASRRPEISHVYSRETSPTWHYNLYTMIHARSLDEITRSVDLLSRQFRCTDFKVLRTVREYVKRPPDYSAILGDSPCTEQPAARLRLHQKEEKGPA